MSVGVNTAAAGAQTGTVTLNYQTAGAVNGVSNGLGTASAGSQVITVSGNVYQLAAGQIQTAALNFGTVQVGQTVAQNLVIRNTATGPNDFVEDLNAAFGSSTDARIIGTGALNGILAGTDSTNANGTMTVSINTGTAGTVNGAIRVNYDSAGAVNGTSNGLGTLGVGFEDYAASGTIIQGNVIDQARPVINGVANPNAVAVSFGNVRINTAANQTLTVLNQATGNQQAALNASIASNGAPVTASGSFAGLLPGNSIPGQSGIGTPLQVGIDTSTAGARSGSATVTLVSDASNVGNCQPNCQLNLPNQIVNVSADVYRLANPTLNTTSLTLAGRVGGVGDTTHLTGAISITNTSPDIYTETLNVARGANVAGFTGTGGPIDLVAGASSNAIQVSLNTSAAGHVGGNQTFVFTSTGAETGAGAVTVSPTGASTVALSGNVYTPAVAQQNTAAVNFGIVHVGDVVAAQGVSVTNGAAATALNDVLRAQFAGATGPFTGGGNLGAGLGAGQTDSSSLSVGMSTGTAGIYSGTATFSCRESRRRAFRSATGRSECRIDGAGQQLRRVGVRVRQRVRQPAIRRRVHLHAGLRHAVPELGRVRHEPLCPQCRSRSGGPSRRHVRPRCVRLWRNRLQLVLRPRCAAGFWRADARVLHGESRQLRRRHRPARCRPQCERLQGSGRRHYLAGTRNRDRAAQRCAGTWHAVAHAAEPSGAGPRRVTPSWRARARH